MQIEKRNGVPNLQMLVAQLHKNMLLLPHSLYSSHLRDHKVSITFLDDFRRCEDRSWGYRTDSRGNSRSICLKKQCFNSWISRITECSSEMSLTVSKAGNWKVGSGYVANGSHVLCFSLIVKLCLSWLTDGVRWESEKIGTNLVLRHVLYR